MGDASTATSGLLTRNRTAILLLLVAALYLGAVNNQWAITSDSSLYLGTGRSLVEGRGMTFNGKDQWGLPPLVPLMIAGCRLLVGSHYWLINLVVTAFALGMVGMTWLILRQVVPSLPRCSPAAFTFAVLLAVGTSARLFSESCRIMTDVPFGFFVLGGIVCFIRGCQGRAAWLLLGTAAWLGAVMTRLVPGLVLYGAALASVPFTCRRPGWAKRLGAAAGGAAILAGGMAAWVVLVRSRAEPGSVDYVGAALSGRFLRVDFEQVKRMADAVTHIPAALCGSLVDQKMPYLNLVPTLLLAAGLWRMVKARQWVIVLTIGGYVGFLVYYAVEGVAARYFLPVMPLLAYGVLLGTETLAAPARHRLSRRARRLRRKQGRGRWDRFLLFNLQAWRRTLWASVYVAACLAAAISLPKVARGLYWMRHPQFYEVFDHGRWKAYRETAAYLARRGERGSDRVLAPKGAVVHYLCRLRTESMFRWRGKLVTHFDMLTPEEFTRAARQRGYAFVVVDAPPPPSGAISRLSDEEAWAREVARALRASGAFLEPAVFGSLAVYECAAAPREGRPRGGLAPGAE